MRTALARVHKYFTLMCHFKSDKSESLGSSAEHMAQQLLAGEKIIFRLKQNIFKSVHGMF